MSMQDVLLQFAMVFAGTFTVLGGWIVLQSYVRRRSGCAADHDVLDFMAHSCGSCYRGQTCQTRMKHAGLNPGPAADKPTEDKRDDEGARR